MNFILVIIVMHASAYREDWSVPHTIGRYGSYAECMEAGAKVLAAMHPAPRRKPQAVCTATTAPPR